MSVFTKRLKEARLAAGLSQERLGIEAGIDPVSASARMNRYELGKREPDLVLVERLAEVLNVPMPYLYADDEQFAELILGFGMLSEAERVNVIRTVEEAVQRGRNSAWMRISYLTRK